MSVTSRGLVSELSDDERFRLLVEAVTDCAIYMMDVQGFITSWNSGAQRLKGYQPIEIIGQHFSRFFTPEDRSAGVPVRILAEALSKGQSKNEGWRVRKDGRRFWASAAVEIVKDDSGRTIGLAKITRDITQRREAELALIESERRFRMLVDGAIDYAIYMLDPSGVITNWNKGAERITGYSADEIVGQHLSRFFTKDDRAAGIPARGLEIAAREGRFETEGWRIRKDGSRFWVHAVVDAIRNEAGELLGFAKITRDVTERRAAHDALRESETQFSLLVKGVTDYALFMLDPNGIVISWNAGAERIKGYEANEIIGQHFSRFYTEEGRSAGAPARSLHMATESGRFESEGWRVRKDGSLFWANVVIDTIRDDDGHLVGFAKITRDITERRNAQIALQQTQAQLAQAQKMEALGQLTGGVAHDFNNLLMIVSGQMRALRKLLADNEKGQRAADAIDIAVKRGEALTRQLLAFSRRQDLNPVVVGLYDRLDALRTLLSSSVGGLVSLGITILPDVWPIEVDVSELDLALVNLTANARDAMPQGGLVTISVENTHLESGDTPAGLQGDFVAVTVADTGPGIPTDILSKVFDPFFTTKPAGKGTGLGLSQVHGFVHQSGGTLTIWSEVGVGTRVTMYLRRAHAAPQRASTGKEGVERTTGGKALLVEDNPDVADATHMLLEELGYDVKMVTDPQDALHALDNSQYDLVLSDIVMPGPMNGIELARRLRAKYPSLPIVLATGYNNAADEAANEFIVLRKPYQLTELARAIANPISRAESAGATDNLIDFREIKRDRASKFNSDPH